MVTLPFKQRFNSFRWTANYRLFVGNDDRTLNEFWVFAQCFNPLLFRQCLFR